ncbi:MAG: hypothetical protein U0P46_04915 [Holophagaceae bacterium]
MTPKPIREDLDNPQPESAEQDQAALEASLTTTTQATAAPKSGGTGTIKVTG